MLGKLDKHVFYRVQRVVEAFFIIEKETPNVKLCIAGTLEKDDANNTFSLQAGIESSKKGHLFAGKAIANIKEILPVKEIVQHLWPKN